MSKEAIIDKIISDAQAESREIIAQAEEAAEKIKSESYKTSEKARRATERETAEKCKIISERKAAAVRLESAKIFLEQKRRVIDEIYNNALKRLVNLNEEECESVIGRLLEKYAEDGDVIYFADNFLYPERIALLPVVQDKQLEISKEHMPINGGIFLKGKISDKDLSYGALLSIDRDEYQAKIASVLFNR